MPCHRLVYMQAAIGYFYVGPFISPHGSRQAPPIREIKNEVLAVYCLLGSISAREQIGILVCWPMPSLPAKRGYPSFCTRGVMIVTVTAN